WREIDPENSQALLFQGMLYELMGRRQEAAATYREVLEHDPDCHEARMQMAVEMLDLLRAKEAMPHLEYLRQRQPDNLSVQVYLAQCLYQVGDAAQAIEVLDRLLARFPHYPLALAERGKLALRSGQLQEAEHYLRDASTSLPADYEVHFGLYQCYL